MPPAPHIRRLVPEDEPRFAAFLARCVERKDLIASAAPHGDYVVKLVMADPSKAAIAEQDGTILGMVLPAPKALVVHPIARYMGLGTRLVEEGLAIERESGNPELIIGVEPDDKGRQTFLTKTGFAYHSTVWDLELPPDRDVAEPAWPDGVVTRPLDRDGDLDAFTGLFNAAFADHPTPLQLDAAQAHLLKDDPDFLPAEHTLVVEAGDGTLIGFCATEPRFVEDGVPGPWAEIWTIGVRPEHQGRGLGRALLRWGARHLREVGIPAVALSVNGRNPRALALYEAEGFERVRTRDRWARPVDPAG
jgi:mycothiol synthase